MGHQPLHRAKRMFGYFPAMLHPYRVGHSPAVHRLPRILVKIAHDRPSRRVRALRLQGTAAARRTCVLFLLLRAGGPEQAQRGASRALPAVACGIVGKLVTAEVLLPAWIDGLGTRHNGSDVLLLAKFAMLAIRIAGVGHYGHLVGAHRHL